MTELRAGSPIPDGDKGDITVSGGAGAVWTIDAAAVTLAKQANLAEATMQGRAAGAGTGVPQALSADQVSTVLDTAADPFIRTSAGAAGGAVLVFAQGGTAGHSPADATTYVFGDRPALGAGTAETIRVTVPMAGTIKKAYGIFVSGVLASAGNSTLTIHNRTAATSELISNAVALTASPSRFNNTSLSLAFSAGDELDISWLTPTWATNPTGVFCIVHVYVEFS